MSILAVVSTTRALRVPLVDLARSNSTVKEAILREIAGLIDSGAFTNGPAVPRFESAFAQYCGAAECVGLASGLDALRLGLLASGIEPGDEVLVPANTFVATFEAVTQAGGVPVPVDASMSDYNLDPRAADAAVTTRTRFLLPVHLYGQLADMQTLSRVATRHELTIIEDACQAQGAARDDVRSGELSTCAAFSFYPGKNLGAFGDAGALTTDDFELAGTVRALREHGQRGKYIHDIPGYTARLDTIQAIVLEHKLGLLEDANRSRRWAASYYRHRLDGVGDLRMPPVAPNSSPVWHLFVIHTEYRDALAEHLADYGIATGLHYPTPPHLSEAYTSLGHRKGSFPVSESLSQKLVSIPIFPGIREDELEIVSGSISGFFRDGR